MSSKANSGLLIDGQPPKMFKAGESLQHSGPAPSTTKAGDKGAKVNAIYVVEKGKPLASPAQ